MVDSKYGNDNNNPNNNNNNNLSTAISQKPNVRFG